jgi:hypothetical protein
MAIRRARSCFAAKHLPQLFKSARGMDRRRAESETRAAGFTLIVTTRWIEANKT